MTPDPYFLNRITARLCREFARDDAEAATFLDMCGVLAADGSLLPDDTATRRVSDLEIAGGSWAGGEWA